MSKILIIGQAPAAVKQTLPYDTTMLYDWLKEINVSKEEAQELFDFEAVYNEFTGFDAKGGHKKPTKEQMQKYWEEILRDKVESAEKVWLVGNVASEFFHSQPKTWSCNLFVLETIHPSKRNFDRYNKNKKAILKSIWDFLYYGER